MSYTKYTPLDESLDEIRLLSILPSSSGSEKLCCTLRTVSLQDFCPNYRNFTESHKQYNQSRRRQAAWVSQYYIFMHAPSHNRFYGDDGLIRRRTTDINEQVVHNRADPQRNAHVPSESLSRFQWGDFAALSYCWGPEDHATAQMISLNGEEVEVRANLADALRTFREINYFSGNYGLWVDAVCIDQGNLTERESQVKKMQNLYAGCWTVTVFLGKAEDKSEKAVQLLKQLARYQRGNKSGELSAKLLQNPQFLGIDGGWAALSLLVKRPYWQRLWIIQELALAPQEAMMFVGNASISWPDVQDGLWSVHCEHWGSINQYLKNDFEILKVPERERSAYGWGGARSLHHISKTLALVVRRKQKGEELAFIDVLDAARNTLCKEPVDRVYGLLTILNPGISSKIQVDYNIQPSAVFVQFARLTAKQTGRLDLLCEASIWRSIFGSPSWAPDLSWQSSGGFSRSYYRFTQLSHYQADAGLDAQPWFTPDGLLLMAKGVIIGTIDSVHGSGLSNASHASVRSKEPNSLRAHGRSAKATLHEALIGGTAIWVNDAALPLVEFAKVYLDGCTEVEKRRWSEVAVHETDFEMWEKCFHLVEFLFTHDNDILRYMRDLSPAACAKGTEAHLGIPIDYWHFVFTHKQRKFVRTREGRYGWAPENVPSESEKESGNRQDQVRSGDHFVVVFGCKVPPVVREHKNGFKILGEGYPEGFMDGGCHGNRGRSPVSKRDGVLLSVALT